MRARLGKETPGGFAGDLGGPSRGEDDPARRARRVSETGSEPRQRALVCGPRASASRRGESECGRVGPAFACEQAAWRGPSGLSRLGLTGLRGWLGFWVSYWVSIFLFYFLFFSFLNLIQTKFEFKYGFEFKPHSNKSMHQHECDTKY